MSLKRQQVDQDTEYLFCRIIGQGIYLSLQMENHNVFYCPVLLAAQIWSTICSIRLLHPGDYAHKSRSNSGQ
jgi:hypothetical protein